MSSPRAFQAVVSPQLDKKLWQELLDGRTGILRIPDFLPPERRRAALEQLDGGPFFAAYDPTDECGGIDPEAHRQIRDDLLAGSLPGEPPVPRRLGRTLYEYSARGKPEEYFKRVTEFESERRSVFVGQDDIIDDLLELVRRVSGGPASMAEEPEYGPYYAGVIREVYGRSRLHTDDAREETPQFSVAALPFQVGFYIIFEIKTGGGALTVYEREHRESDKPFRQGYGTDPRAVACDSFVGITPQAGDLILFPDRHIHWVDAASGDGRRIMMQAHLGVDDTGAVVCWS